MRGIFIWLAIVAVSILASSPGLARDSLEAELPECTKANSVRVSIAELWADEAGLSGECVGLEGYRLADVIFTDQRALYHYAARRSSSPKGIVGVPYPAHFYSDEPGLMRGVYYGRVESCREQQRSYRRTLRAMERRPPGDEIILVHLYGFCASSTGPALRVDTADEAPSSRFARLTGAGIRKTLGELVPIEGDYPHRATVAWLEAIATDGGCAPNFTPSPAPDEGPVRGRNGAFYDHQDPVRSDQLALWCASGKREIATFTISRTSPARADSAELDVLICLCTTEDCTDRWPVALLDSDWIEGRPYFCQRATLVPRRTSYGDDGSVFSDYSYDFQIGGNGLGTIWREWGFAEPPDR